MRFRIAIGLGSASCVCAAVFACGNDSFDASSSDASIADSSSDAVITADAIAAADAGTDSSDPCAVDSGYAFCDDFDHGALSGIWNGRGVSCMLPAVTMVESVTPPGSLIAADPLNDASCSQAGAEIAASTAAKIHCEADIKIDALSTQRFSFFQISDAIPSTTYHAVTLLYTGDDPNTNQPVFMTETSGYVDGGTTVVATTVKVGKGLLHASWFHVAVTVDYGTRLATAVVGGVTQTLPLGATPVAITSSTLSSLTLGYSYIGASDPTVVHYDNAFCQAQ